MVILQVTVFDQRIYEYLLIPHSFCSTDINFSRQKIDQFSELATLYIGYYSLLKQVSNMKAMTLALFCLSGKYQTRELACYG